MNSILYEKEITLNAIDSAYEKGKKDGSDSIVEELEKIFDKIDFEEKWLIDIKMENGFISIADIRIAMCRIRQVISELKGENNGTHNDNT